MCSGDKQFEENYSSGGKMRVRKVETISQPKHAWNRPGFIISTNKSGLLKYIATRKTQRYIIEVTDMKTYTGCVVFDYELYDGGVES